MVFSFFLFSRGGLEVEQQSSGKSTGTPRSGAGDGFGLQVGVSHGVAPKKNQAQLVAASSQSKCGAS